MDFMRTYCTMLALVLYSAAWVSSCDRYRGELPVQQAGVAEPSTTPLSLPTPMPPTPSPTPVVARSPSSDETTHSRKQGAAETGPTPDEVASLSSIDARIGENEALLRSLREVGRSQPSVLANELRIQEFRQSQQNAVLQFRLSELSDRIKSQERAVETARLAVQATVGVEGSTVMETLQKNIAQAQTQLDSLRNQYTAIVASQAAAIEENYARQTQQLSATSGLQDDLTAEIEAAMKEMDQLSREKRQIQDTIARRGNMPQLTN